MALSKKDIKDAIIMGMQGLLTKREFDTFAKENKETHREIFNRFDEMQKNCKIHGEKIADHGARITGLETDSGRFINCKLSKAKNNNSNGQTNLKFWAILFGSLTGILTAILFILQFIN